MNDPSTPHLVFSLSGVKLALVLRTVREIVEYVPPTPVPSSPPFVLGVVNRRGEVVPVIDLCGKLGLPPSPRGRRACTIFLDVPGHTGCVGVACDAVDDLVELSASEIDPPPDFGVKVRIELLLGIGRKNGELLSLIDPGLVLSAEELSAADIVNEVEQPADAVAAD